MILKGNQRGHAYELSTHLLNDENDHVSVHEISGFASDNLTDALQEAYALSKATKCKQYLFSMSFNPPPKTEVGIETFDTAIEKAENKLGLTNQPRAVVFHEKEGRRHAHVVWSRIIVDELKAVQLSFSKRKMQELSRELFLENDWDIPRGISDPSLSDPRNFTMDQWQQARRNKQDPREIKSAISHAWKCSDSISALTNALQDKGFKLARGDKRGYVLVDYKGEIYSLPKWAGIKTRVVRKRLGDPSSLPNIADTKSEISKELKNKISSFSDNNKTRLADLTKQHERKKSILVRQHRTKRSSLIDQINTKKIQEIQKRCSRFTTGIRGVWDKLRGEHKRIKSLNEKEAHNSTQRDTEMKENLISSQLKERQMLQKEYLLKREFFLEQQHELNKDARQIEERLNPKIMPNNALKL